jgi:3-phenylpropionate/trans-cinnamate dioxygenase ferredoxin reductase subunit
VLPNAELAEEAGVACDNGILVDEFARTSDPDIVAAGDCTMHANVLFDVRHRLESVQNALDQARIAAGTLLGRMQPYAQVPWFWSDQYDVELQIVGIAQDYDQHVVRGEIEESTFSVFYFDSEKLLAVDSINSVADHMICRRLMSSGINVSPNEAADRKLDLKDLLPK